MSDIDVQLYLIANDDIDRLEKALATFHNDVDSMQKLSKGGFQGGTGRAQSGRTGGLWSQMPLAQQAQAWGVARAAQTNAQVGTSGGLVSRMGGAINRVPGMQLGKTIYSELPGGNLLQKAGWGLAFGPQVLGTLGGLGGAFSNAAYGGGFTNAGTQLGNSNSNGLFGGGLFSSAWQQGVLNSLYGNVAQGLLNANPYGAQGVALAAQSGFSSQSGLIQALGLSSNNSVGARVGAMAGSALKAGATEDVVSQWIESLRYGSTNLAELNGRIQDLGNLAKGAHMSVGAFTSQLQQVSDQMQTNLGVTNFQAGQQVSALSAISGLTPEMLGQVTTDQSNMWLAVAQAGGDPYKALQGSGGGMNLVKAFGMKILGFLGVQNYQEAAAIFAQPGSAQYRQGWDRLWYAYQSKLIPFPPQQAITFIKRFGGMTNTRSGYSAVMQLQNDLGQNSVTDASLSKTIGQLRSSGLLSSHAIDQIMNKSQGQGNKSTVSDLLAAIGIKSGQKTDQAATGTVKVELTGYAKKLFQIDQSQSNQQSAQSRAANVAVTSLGIR